MSHHNVTARRHAEYIYLAKTCKGELSTMDDFAIIECRVRAFVDGANWVKRQLKRPRAPKRSASDATSEYARAYRDAVHDALEVTPPETKGDAT
jgi:hypothetical protein